LKTLGNVPVRLVFYQDEGHGTSKAAARYDTNLRIMRWMDHYLKGPGGDPPPKDLDYGALQPQEE
jgi:dipeptidyl aminopeptidase/acylaminoacyl peptidase